MMGDDLQMGLLDPKPDGLGSETEVELWLPLWVMFNNIYPLVNKHRP